MARVFLTTLYPKCPNHSWWLGCYQMFLASARLAKGRKHQLADTPEAADIVLFSDSGPGAYQSAIRKSTLFRRYYKRCFVHAPDDLPLPLLPGVYASIEKRWHDSRWTRSGFYIHSAESGRFGFQEFNRNARWLFSFVGSCSNAPVRMRLARLRHPRFHLVDSSGKVVPAYSTGDRLAIEELNKSCREVVRESKFVLCPRGVGCSSQRLFEVMAMGRCPVIVSDDWVPPEGPRWELCSLRVPEAGLSALPELLENRESDAQELGRHAREEWERWFSEPVLFETVVDWCLAIKQAGRCGDPWYRRAKYLQLLRPTHLRKFLRGRNNALPQRSKQA